MAGNKVKFHTLERLDINDIEAIQTNIEDYDVSSLGHLVGAEGCLSAFSTGTINNTSNYFTISDFSFLTRLTGATKQARVGIYDNSNSLNSPSTNQINFATYKTLTQSYYNSNTALPPAPSSSSFVEETHGTYYPFIWAKAIEVETDNDSRRFWSVSLGQEVTQNVNTRISQATQVTISPNRPTTGDWSKVGRIYAWSVSGATVSLQQVRALHITDSLLNLPSQNNAITTYGSDTGLRLTFYALTQALNTMLNNGSSDPSGVVETNWYAAPARSLNGLSKYVDTYIDFLVGSDNTTRKDNSKVTISYLFANNSTTGSTIFFGKNDSDNDFTVTGDLNYTFAAANGVAAGTQVDSMSANNKAITCSNIVIRLPEIALGKKIHSLNLNLISPNSSGDLMSNTPGVVNSIYDLKTLRYLSDDASLVYNNFTYVREETFKDINHNTITAPAILLNISPNSFASAADIRFCLQVELTLDLN